MHERWQRLADGLIAKGVEMRVLFPVESRGIGSARREHVHEVEKCDVFACEKARDLPEIPNGTGVLHGRNEHEEEAKSPPLRLGAPRTDRSLVCDRERIARIEHRVRIARSDAALEARVDAVWPVA